MIGTPSRVTRPPDPSTGDSRGRAPLQRQRKHAEIFNIPALVGGEKVVGRTAIDGFDGATGYHADKPQRVDTDSVQFRLCINKVGDNRRVDCLSRRAKYRRTSRPLCKQIIDVDGRQLTQCTRLDNFSRLLHPGLVVGTKHLAAHAGPFDRRDSRVGVCQIRCHRLVDIDVLAGVGTTGSDAAATLRVGAD